MKVLAVDTSTWAGSLALLDGPRLVSIYLLDIKAAHSERVLPAIDGILRDAGWTIRDIELIACAKGPGSFTGLRIGLATAKGLAFARGLPLVGVNSLEAAALGQAYATTPICAMLDGRKRQVFAARFQPDGRGGLERTAEDVSVDAGEYAGAIEGPCLFVGDGAALYAERILRAKPDAILVPQALEYPHAGGVGWLGMAAHARGEGGLVAHYVRLSDAEMDPKFAPTEG